MENNTTSHHVTVSSEFFAHAFRDYSDPATAWVREIFQNSADAPGCKNINFELGSDEENVMITVTNDGRPMDRNVLTNKLLCLGGSQKEAGNVGGFGKAKELLYFAQNDYMILTGDLVVSGKGGDYDIDTNHSFLAGTTSMVSSKFTRSEVETAIYRVVCLSGWKGSVTLNTGDGPQQVNGRLRKGYRRVVWDWATVYTNKQGTNRLVVRMGGIPMFSKWCAYSEGTVVVELHGDSVDCLTSNRDGLLYSYGRDLDELVSKIAVDKRSAFRWQTWERTTYGSGMIRNIPTSTEVEARAVVQNIFKGLYQLSAEDMKKNLENSPNSVQPDGRLVQSEAPVESTAPVEDRGVLPQRAEEDLRTETVINHGAGQQIQVDHEFVIKNGIHDTKGYQRKVPAKFRPCGEFSPYSKRLTRIWAGLITTLYKLDERSGAFRVGFIFSDDCKAEFERMNDGKVTYYINPAEVVVKSTRVNWNQCWKTKMDRSALIAAACHEYAHLTCGTHDEDYAAELTRVMELAFDNINDLKGCF